MTLRASSAEDVRLPLVPWKVTVAVLNAAEDAAVKVMDMPAVVIEKGEEGVDVTPLGKPVSETMIDPLKPFCVPTEMFTVALWPTSIG